eukprot:TRINITY_DN9005_c0_g1_i5.p1 TRINITY_DN9005_c0_g1~~TRINITY_DN9005_c0_g1_i5.p1  ORF type:complete len:448 (-),score=65.43 TRINITY_DN9005_c0_g1_i5:208-1551(-)
MISPRSTAAAKNDAVALEQIRASIKKLKEANPEFHSKLESIWDSLNYMATNYQPSPFIGNHFTMVQRAVDNLHQDNMTASFSPLAKASKLDEGLESLVKYNQSFIRLLPSVTKQLNPFVVHSRLFSEESGKNEFEAPKFTENSLGQSNKGPVNNNNNNILESSKGNNNPIVGDSVISLESEQSENSITMGRLGVTQISVGESERVVQSALSSARDPFRDQLLNDSVPILQGTIVDIRPSAQSQMPREAPSLNASLISYRSTLDNTNTDVEQLMRSIDELRVSSHGENCSLNRTGNNYATQHAYQCEECNINNNYMICSFCAHRCHSTHKLKYIGTKTYFCDCAYVTKRCLGLTGCTYNFTGEDYQSQPRFQCKTCVFDKNHISAVCSFCVEVCHKDHDIHFVGFTTNFCDCLPQNPYCKGKIDDPTGVLKLRKARLTANSQLQALFP